MTASALSTIFLHIARRAPATEHPARLILGEELRLGFLLLDGNAPVGTLRSALTLKSITKGVGEQVDGDDGLLREVYDIEAIISDEATKAKVSVEGTGERIALRSDCRGAESTPIEVVNDACLSLGVSCLGL